MEFKTFAITFRPRNGVTDYHVEKCMKWVRKHSLYYHVITEKSGSAKHIHAAVFLHKEKTKSNVCVMWCGLFSDLDPEEKTVLRRGVKILYNYDWINSYLDKDDETVVVSSNLPEKSHLESWFPEKPVTVNAESRVRKCSVFYHELADLWRKHQPVTVEVNTMNARDFLFKLMYGLKCINIIRDDKAIIQTARHLVRFINGTCQSTIELPVFEKEE